MSPRWRIFVDTGGTFTDALAVAPDGVWRRAKVLSSGALRATVVAVHGPREVTLAVSWQAGVDVLRGGEFRLLGPGHGPSVRVRDFDPGTGRLVLEEPVFGAGAEPPLGAACEIGLDEPAPLVATRLLTGTAAGKPLPPVDMRLGTTRATNALLTRTGAPVALFITRGFGDLLRIRTQQRPDLFALRVRRTEPLPEVVVEVPGRVAANGIELEALDLEPLRGEVERLRARGITTAAVALLHSDRHPGHERKLGAWLREVGLSHVSCSAELAETVRLLPRAATAVVDAHLAPVVTRHLESVAAAVCGGGEGRLHVMTSAGGLVTAQTVRPKDMLLSGPAGGVVGAARAGRRAGFDRVLSFDMGGTSTDVARYGGAHAYVFEHTVGAAHLFAPALAIETVAAGGGSICRCGPNGLAVGPDSAGADPGPASYGAGGPLTLTDVNLLLGRLDPRRIGIPVDPEPARHRLDEVLAALREQTGETPAPEAVLDGFRALADERMADAIVRISVGRGDDPADHALVAFGGAGGQHACALGERLGVEAVVVPPDAGLLSAWGMAGAVLERFAARQVLRPLGEVEKQVAGWLEALAGEALAELRAEGVPQSEAVVRRRLAEMRLVGQESALVVEVPDEGSLEGAFRRHYEEVYGHLPVDRASELVGLRVVASSRAPAEPAPQSPPAPLDAVPQRAYRAWFDGAWQQVPVFDRDRLAPGATLSGPALVVEAHAATVVESGWRLVTDGHGALVMRPSASRDGAAQVTRPEAVQIELFSARFEAIARSMGAALERTAVSTNVKERLDFSCALLDPAGRLVVNAPHIPVHLGSLGLCVRAVVAAVRPGAGDMVLTNHPAFGGSHLPDLTVIAPVCTSEGVLLGHVAARAHHAELGGTRPGSMPPGARALAEEGVVIPPTVIVTGGREQFDDVRTLLTAPPWPSRAVADNLADLRAAVAACRRGAAALGELAAVHGPENLLHYMDALRDKSNRRLREALGALPDGEFRAVENLDDGTPLAVCLTVAGERATVDFTGTAGVHPGNLNATPAIVHSVLVYVLRLLVRKELPLNDGLLEPVDIVLPEGLLNPPFGDDPTSAPAVVGGNVEVSQRLTDVLLRALGLVAASQGTMNNVLFGDENFSYYETVGGGTGAGDGFAGESGVHSHMTNTRITDPEILELRYPVRVWRFTLRRDSGGRGRWPGGDGLVRELEFLAPLELSVMAQRRHSGPYGLAGGEAGQPGRQRLHRPDGTVVELPGIASFTVGPGDRLILETPGGGGYGRPSQEGSACDD